MTPLFIIITTFVLPAFLKRYITGAYKTLETVYGITIYIIGICEYDIILKLKKL